MKMPLKWYYSGYKGHGHLDFTIYKGGLEPDMVFLCIFTIGRPPPKDQQRPASSIHSKDGTLKVKHRPPGESMCLRGEAEVFSVYQGFPSSVDHIGPPSRWLTEAPPRGERLRAKVSTSPTSRNRKTSTSLKPVGTRRMTNSSHGLWSGSIWRSVGEQSMFEMG